MAHGLHFLSFMKNSVRLLEIAILVALTLGLTVFIQMTAWAAEPTNTGKPYACVLNFERKIHPLSKILDRKFGGMDGVELIHEARPIDMLKCLDEGVVSLILVTHAGDLGTKSQVTAPLVYFRELKGEERQQALDSYQKKLDAIVAEFKKKVRENKVGATEGGYYFHAFEADERLRKLPANVPIYTTPFFENQIFRRILANPENLKKLSIISCLPEKVAAYYPELQELQGHGVDVEFGPINKFFSWLFGEHVSSPNYGWIKRNLSESKKLAEDPADASGGAVRTPAAAAR